MRLLWWINVIYCAVWHRLEAGDSSTIPGRGPAILIANHTCNIDPMVLQASCERVLGFMIAKEFYDYWLFHPMCSLLGCIPVRRDGQDLGATRAALRALADGRVLPVFPEGRIIPSSGQELGDAKPGVAFLVLHAKVPVIPAYIWGTPRTNNIWKAFFTPSNAHVIFGKPIDLSDIVPDRHADRATLVELTSRLMTAIRELRSQALRAEPVEGSSVEIPADSDRDSRRPDGHRRPIPGDHPALRGA